MQQVLEILKSNQTTLFLGAGSSIGIGGPSGKRLLDEVTNEFSDVIFSNDNNFFDVCKDIIESENHSRPELEKFIIKQLDGLYPNEKHIELISLPWKCIFTTNYDIVLERIPQDKSEGRIIRSIKEQEPEIELERQDILYYIKIFGSIDAPYGEEGYPILSRTDHSTSFLRRNSYYKILSDCIRKGPIIFLGYSFEDNLVFDIMDELQQVVGPDIIRPSYAISPNKPSIKIQKLFSKYKIFHITGTFEDFVSSAYSEFKNKKFKPVYSQKTIHVHGVPIDIPTSLERPSKEYFSFLHSSSIDSNTKDLKQFFNRDDLSFYPYLKRWDFIRNVYSFDGTKKPINCEKFGTKVTDGLKRHIFRLIKDPKSESNDKTILTGPAGCGKTIILNRLAFDWFTSGLPVIFMQPQGPNIDFRQVDSFILYIEENFKKSDKNVRFPRPRTLIICDHASSLYHEYLKLFDFLSSRGRLVSMVISDRENKLIPLVQGDVVIYSIPETISKEEIKSFSDYLLGIGLIKTDVEIFGLINDPEINSSFFALLYIIIDGSRRPLNSIIHDQYISLSGWPKQVYEYICLFNYYNINPNEQLLVRSTVDYTNLFRKELEDGALKKVIFAEGVEWDNIDYRVHHPIIASITVKMEMNDPTIRVQKLLEILSKLNPHLGHEVKKIERFLIFEIGPNSPENEIPILLKKEIFNLVSSIVKSRSIFHHYALLELEGDNKDFNHAKQLLDIALSIKYNNSERDELIFTSFGKLYSQKGYQLEDEGNFDEALDAFDLAEKYFLNGRNRNFKNKYSYHGQIVLNRRRVEKTTDSLEKVILFSKAIELCEDALSNLSQTDHPEILKQEAILMHLIGNICELDSIIERLANEYNSPVGYRLKANILLKNSFKLSDTHRTQVLEDAYKFTEKGLVIDNTDQGLLRIQTKIGIELFPTDIDKQYEILKKWHDFSDRSDLKLLYHYASVLFELDYYEDSKKIFSDLDFQSQGIPQRSSIFKSYFIMENGEKKKYHGIVMQLDPNSRKGFINCVSLPNLKYKIPFFPILFSPVEGDYVVFNIGFNMRGIFGFDVSKD
jgi:tetratricopeptide (TPR) repeat protein